MAPPTKVLRSKVLRYGYCAEVTPTTPFTPLVTTLLTQDIKTVQFYPPTGQLATPTELAWLATTLPAHHFRFNVHAPHTVNLAKPTVPGLNRLLGLIGELPGSVVVHTGQIAKTVGIPTSLAQIWANLNDPHLKTGPTILLENAAGEGSLSQAKIFEYGRTVEELTTVFEGVEQTHRFGLCLDTQHSFAGGICTWGDTATVDRFLDEVEAALPQKLQSIHLNGSYKVFGARVDRHAPLGYVGETKRDHIWPAGHTSGLRRLLERAIDHDWDVISETSDPWSDLTVIQNVLRN